MQTYHQQFGTDLGRDRKDRIRGMTARVEIDVPNRMRYAVGTQTCHQRVEIQRVGRGRSDVTRLVDSVDDNYVGLTPRGSARRFGDCKITGCVGHVSDDHAHEDTASFCAVGAGRAPVMMPTTSFMLWSRGRTTAARRPSR